VRGADDLALRNAEAVAVEVTIAAVALHRDLRITPVAVDVLVLIHDLVRSLGAGAIPAVQLGFAPGGPACHRGDGARRTGDAPLSGRHFTLRLLLQRSPHGLSDRGRSGRLGAIRLRGCLSLALVLFLFVIVIRPHHLRD